ncbi:MAG: DUF3794 domain-containing protein [Defluviitaleaceae bacterium]|nr:DUF3794 domain-containing protein [Defluviitaleaceae bacterium]
MMELVREKIVLSKHIGREKSQVLLEGDIIVPDTKPDIASVLKTEAGIVISKVNPMSNRISYSGKLGIKILYMSRDGEASVHSISTSAPVDDFFNMEGVSADMWINLSSEIANIDYRIVNDRKLNYRAVVDIGIDVSENSSMNVVQSIEELPIAQQKTTIFTMSNLIEKASDEFTIKDEMVLPSNKPAIRELLTYGTTISGKEIRVLNGRVDISGELIVTPLYKGVDEDSVIELAEFELPFSGSIDVAVAKDGDFGDVLLNVIDSMVTVSPNEDGDDRILALEVVIGADIRISQNQELEILEDAYCIDQNLIISKESMDYRHLVCRNKNQFNVKEIVTLEGAPEILQILSVTGVVNLEDKKVVDDKVVVEGIVSADILYVANSDDAPLYNHKAILPIRQVIETKGARLGMEADVEQSIEHIGFNMLSGKEVEVRFLLSADTLVQESVQAEYISDIEFSPLNKEEMDSMPSMVVLCVQKSDSLWSIAKKYNASLEELAAINDIDSTAELRDGQRLLVVKKINTDEE